jgi:16S rRNA processing protein RimM
VAAGTKPADAVEVGRIVGAFGVKGWIKIQPFSLDGSTLLGTKTWWLQAEGPRAAALPAALTVLARRNQGDAIVAQVTGVDDRDAAEALRGCTLMVSRSEFPKTPDGEYYWLDLIGLAVVNQQGAALGQVIGLIDTGPHCVFRIAPVGRTEPGPAEEVLIPFVAAYVLDVSLSERRILVDWALDWNQP